MVLLMDSERHQQGFRRLLEMMQVLMLLLLFFLFFPIWRWEPHTPGIFSTEADFE